MNWRMLGPNDAQKQTMSVNGRAYNAAAGQPIDVPDFDGAPLSANGWIFVARSGSSAQRPVTSSNAGLDLEAGNFYFDTTLSKLIVFDGAAWRDPTTGNSV